MKKGKFLFLITLILITCTGCDIEYNINITKNNIEEVINVSDYITSTRTKEEIESHYSMWYPTFVNFLKDGETIEIRNFNKKIDGVEYHNKNINTISNGYKYTYKYNYEIDKYYDSYVLASVFPETTIYEEIDKLVLRTSKKNFLCSYDYFDSATINITIDPTIYKVNYTNSKDTSSNTYTWKLDRDNCDDSEIVLTLDKKLPGSSSSTTTVEQSKENTEQKTNKKSKTSDLPLYIFSGILVILILIGYKIFNKIKNQNNNYNEGD